MLNLSFRQNSFEPDRFICEGALVEYLKSRLLVRVGDRCIEWPVLGVGRLN